MSTNNNQMFEVASRMKFRFQFMGVLSVEDLWDLPLTSLDKIFKELNSQVKQSQEESLLETRTKSDEELEHKIEIIKHIVSVRLEENEKKRRAKERKQQKEKIMEIMANKQDESLQSKSLEELSSMLNELEG